MVTISLRNLPPELERAIASKSKKEGISLAKAATQLLEQAVHPAPRNCDFDEFANTWPAEAASEFETALEAMRKIEPDDWKR